MGKVGKKQLTGELSESIDTLTNHAINDLNHVKYAVDTGTANVKSVAVSLSQPSYGNGGLGISFKNAVENTGAVTLNVNGMGAKPVLKSNGSALTSGNLKANSVYTVRYNGTSFILQGEGGDDVIVVASDTIIYRATSESGQFSNSETLLVSFTVQVGGSYRIKTRMQRYASTSAVSRYIYLNNALVHEIANHTDLVSYDLLNVKPGDVFQIRGKTSLSTGVATLAELHVCADGLIPIRTW